MESSKQKTSPSLKGNILTLDQIDSFLKKKDGGQTGDPNESALRPAIFYGTGVNTIDFALGGETGEMGGFPSGHISEVYGREATGKTSLLYRAIAHNQKKHPDKFHVIFDYECTTDRNYIQNCGVEFTKDKLRIFRPRTLEEGIELLVLFLKTDRLGLAVFDSLASMMPAADLKSKSENLQSVQVASKAKIMSSLLRYLVSEISQSESHVSFINHEIANIVINPYQGGYQPANTTPGGNALKYYSSLRVGLGYKGAVVDSNKVGFDGEEYKGTKGKRIMLHVEKFKFGNPGAKVEYEIRAGEGVDTILPLIEAGIARKIIQKSGNTYTSPVPEMADLRVVGIENCREHFKDNPAQFEVLSDAIAQMLRIEAGGEAEKARKKKGKALKKEESGALSTEVDWDE